MLLAALSPRALAQTAGEPCGRTRISIFAGGAPTTLRGRFIVEDRTTHAGLERSPACGARLTRDIAGPVALDTSCSFAPTHLNLETNASADRLPHALHQASTNLLVFLCGARCELRPFLTTGADFNGYFPRGPIQAPDPLLPLWDRRVELPIHFRPGSNFGGGFEAAFRRRFAVRLDVRDHVSRFPSFWLPSAPSSPGAPYFPPQPHVHGLEVSAAAVFRFR
jgi:hypothetical protein